MSKLKQWNSNLGVWEVVGGISAAEVIHTINGYAVSANPVLTATDVLPNQSAASGMFLTSDGSATSWVEVPIPVIEGYAVTGANTFGGDQTLDNNSLKTIKTATFNGEIATSASSGTIDIDFAQGLYYVQAQPDGNIVYNLLPPTGVARCQIRVVSSGVSSPFTISFSPVPTMYGLSWTTTVANKAALLGFFYDGANWHFMGSNQV